MFVAVNNAPIVSGVKGAHLAYTENDEPVSVFVNSVVLDPVSATLIGAVVWVSAFAEAVAPNSADRLSCSSTSALVVSWVHAITTWTLRGVDTLDHYVGRSCRCRLVTELCSPWPSPDRWPCGTSMSLRH